LLQDAEIEREKAMLDLRIKEQKSITRVITGDSQSDSQNQRVIPAIDYDKVVIDYFKDNPLSSQRKAATKTGISQSQISKTLSSLESAGIIHRNGNGVEILNQGEL
jgi:Fic family protein